MLLKHSPLNLNTLLGTCNALSLKPGEQTQRFICKQTHNLAFEVHDEFIHPDDHPERPEDYTAFLMTELNRIAVDGGHPLIVQGHLEALADFAQAITTESGFQFGDILYNTDDVVALLRLRFTQVSEAGIRGVTVMVSLDAIDYRELWSKGFPGWVDVVYDSPSAVRSVTLFDPEHSTKQSSIRIGSVGEALPFSSMDYPATYNHCLRVTKVVDVQHELDGTAHVVRHRGYIYDRPVAITRMDLVRFTAF